jgi:hypothetical protein
VNEIDGRRIRVPGLAQTTGLISTDRGFHRQTMTRIYLHFEWTDSSAGLRPTPRF